MRLAMFALLGCLCGCVTSGDLLEIRAANQEQTAKIQAEVASYKAGTQSLETAQAAIAAARLEGDARISAVVEKTVERTEEAIALAKQVQDGSISLGEALGGSTGIAGLVAIALNMYRNNTRRRDLELETLRAASTPKPTT